MRAKSITESINKPLTPFIVFFALVILLTIVIANTRSPEPQQQKQDKPLAPPKMELSPFNQRSVAPKSPPPPPPPASVQDADDTPDLKRLFAMASKDCDDGNLAAAEDKLRTALVFEPDSQRALSLLGGILYRTARYQEAEFIFRRQAKLSPEDATVYNNLGAALAKQQKFDEAIKAAEKGLEFDPQSVSAFLNLSGMHSVRGDTRQAIEYFKRAYERLGERILPLSCDPTLDNIRHTPEFQGIISKIEEESSLRPEAARHAPLGEEPPQPRPRE